MISLLNLLSYGAGLAAFIFVTLSLGECSVASSRMAVVLNRASTASGLLWLAEIIEENSKIAKSAGIKLIYVRLPSLRGPPTTSNFL